MTFGFGAANGNHLDDNAEDLGEKGKRQLFLSRLGLPVPPGFILTAPLCAQIRTRGGILSPDVWSVITYGLRCIERASGLTFGDPGAPLCCLFAQAPIAVRLTLQNPFQVLDSTT